MPRHLFPHSSGLASAAGCEVRFRARLEDVEGAGEEERELEGCAEGCVVGVGGEDCYVEWVVLRVALAVVAN